MQYTDVYNLKKPDLNDLPTIRDINENMEVIEEALPSYIKVLYGETVPTSRIPGKFYLISLDETNTNYRVEDSEGNIVHFETNDENVVHKTGDETINGVKTFTSTPFVSGGGTTTGIYLKNTAIARNEVPSTTHYSVLRTLDKNDEILGDYVVMKTDKGATNAQINIRSEDSSGNQLINALNFSMANDDSSVSFAPSISNKVSLGSSSSKWKNAYIDRVVCTRFTHSVNNGSVYITGGSEYDKGATLVLHGEESSDAGGFIISARDKTRTQYLVGKPDGTLQWVGKNIALDENLVHTSGDETINGNKIFSNTIHRYADLTTSGGEQVYAFSDTNANACGHIFNNVHWGGDCIYNIHGAYNNKSGKTMNINIASNDAGFGMVNVEGSATNGNLETVTSETGHTGIATMGWVNNPATSTNVVHRSGDEVISGVKSFNNLMYIYDSIVNKNSQMDLFTTPANTLYAQYTFADKNNEVSAFTQYGQQNTGTDYIGLFIRDKNRALHGIQVTTNNVLEPIANNTYSLGSSNNKWANVYATTFNGSLKGNVETSSLLVNSDTFKHVGSNNGVHYVHRLPQFDGELLGTTFVKVDNGWYRKHSDGFIEQFFYITSVKTFEEKTINFHIPFTTIHYNISVIGSRYASSEPNKTDDLIFTNGNSTPTYAKLYVFDGGDNNYYTDIQVYVCGY